MVLISFPLWKINISIIHDFFSQKEGSRISPRREKQTRWRPESMFWFPHCSHSPSAWTPCTPPVPWWGSSDFSGVKSENISFYLGLIILSLVQDNKALRLSQSVQVTWSRQSRWFYYQQILILAFLTSLAFWENDKNNRINMVLILPQQLW